MATTTIAAGITIEGELTSEDEVAIHGSLKGLVTTKGIVSVASGATVEAEVTAASVQVGGTLTGNVSAQDRVELQAGARLVGDVRTARLTIADGASFKGNVDMDV